ncbi:hypothetical protein EVAR_25715_1 [Eumeta japonica]|uniref:Uncharacterized protein n=1 Tax=Eumeta variegata TaxID=151549 RepID=A0A4C1YUP2_EUMVA|nr:hypothetical protein EVAR_25715_1 [Eumeta japonica]
MISASYSVTSVTRLIHTRTVCQMPAVYRQPSNPCAVGVQAAENRNTEEGYRHIHRSSLGALSSGRGCRARVCSSINNGRMPANNCNAGHNKNAATTEKKELANTSNRGYYLSSADPLSGLNDASAWKNVIRLQLMTEGCHAKSERTLRAGVINIPVSIYPARSSPTRGCAVRELALAVASARATGESSRRARLYCG